MITKHFKILVCSGESFAAMRRALGEYTYQPRMERGFVVTKDEPSFIEGRYIYVKSARIKQLNRETLVPIDPVNETLQEVRFALDLKHGLVSVQGSRGGFNVLFEALDSLPYVCVEFGDLNLNLKEYVSELQQTFNKNEIRALKLSDYIAKENMLARATFKVLDVREGEKLTEKFQDQLAAVKLDFKLPTGKCNVTVSRRGSVSMSDDAPREIIDYARDQLPRFHEAEVETAEVRGGKSLEFKKATGHEPAEFVKKVGEELEKHFGPGEMVDGTLTFNAKVKGKKKDAA